MECPLGAIGVAAFDQRLHQERHREGDAERDRVRAEQLEPGPRVGLGAVDRAAPQVHPAAAVGQICDGRDRLAGARVGERLLEARLGDVECVRRDQAEHEVVVGPDDVELLLVEQAAAGERALEQGSRLARRLTPPRALARQAREHEPFARRRALEVAALLEPPRGRGTRLEARLPRDGGELGLEQQCQLRVLRLDDVDRRLERLHAPIGVPRDGQRVRELARRCRVRRRVADRLDRLAEVSDRVRGAAPQLGASELDQNLGSHLRRGRLGERPPEQRGGGGGRAPQQRVGCHLAQQLDAFLVAGRLRLRDLRRDPLVRGTVRDEHARRPRVRPGPLTGADVGIDGLADDRVSELERVGRREDPERDQQVGGAGRLLLRQLRERGGLGEASPIAEDRGGPHERRGALGPARQREEHGLGDRRGSELTDPLRSAAVAGEAQLARLTQERLQEERVAAGCLAGGLRESLRDAVAEHSLTDRGGRLDAEWRGPHDGRLRGGAQPRRARPPRPHRGEWWPAARRPGHRAEARDRRGSEASPGPPSAGRRRSARPARPPPGC